MASLHDARLAAISSYLLPVAAARKIAHPYCAPTQLEHHFRQPPKGARSPVALRDLKQIQECLTAHALQVIKIYLAAHTFQAQLPRIDRFSRGKVSLRLFQFLHEG